MIKDITLNDLVAVLYNDLDYQPTIAMKKMILSEEVLLEKYLVLRKAKNQLPKKTMFKPSSATIDKILAFNKTSSVY